MDGMIIIGAPVELLLIMKTGFTGQNCPKFWNGSKSMFGLPCIPVWPLKRDCTIDYIDESEVLTPADDKYHVDKNRFNIPFVCGARDLGEALYGLDIASISAENRMQVRGWQQKASACSEKYYRNNKAFGRRPKNCQVGRFM